MGKFVPNTFQTFNEYVDELMMRIENILGDKRGRIQLISVGQHEWKNRIVIGQEDYE